MIADKDTNIVYLSDCLKDDYKDFYKELTSLLDSLNIKHDILNGTKDYWCRDFMPIQLASDKFIKYKYYPDYLLEKKEDKDTITDCKDICAEIGIKYEDIDLIIDGGNVVPCGDVVVMTDKVFTENKERDENEVTKELESKFGCPVVFIPWKKYYGDVYGHSDGFVKYAGGNNILLADNSAASKDVYSGIIEKFKKNGFNVTSLTFEKYCKYNWAYINFLQVGDIIIMPSFNTHNDEVAKKQIEQAFPYCSVLMIEMSELAKKGGALHCITRNIKR